MPAALQPRYRRRRCDRPASQGRSTTTPPPRCVFLACSVPDGGRLEGGPTLLDVDRELHALAPVALHEGVAVLLQRLLELLEREAVRRLAAIALRANELLVDGLPLRGTLARAASQKIRRRLRDLGRLFFFFSVG